MMTTDQKIEDLERENKRLQAELRLLQVGADRSNLFGTRAPRKLLTDYTVDTENPVDKIRRIQRKYRHRAPNINRSWNRAQLYAPELINPSKSFDILEMSTAHGGFLEVMRYFGHNVLGTDYVNMVGSAEGEKNRALFRNLNDSKFSRLVDDYGIPIPKQGEDLVDWPYRQIIESIDIPMALFDGGKLPYPLADKSFDYTFCFQAIEHYCHPKDWKKIIEEFCRISRVGIVVMLNPVMKNLSNDREYVKHFDEFRRNMRDFSQNGFRCSSCHMQWGQTLVFKLIAG